MAEAKIQGIDVSHYQGAIDWAAVAKAGMAFAFIKASDGMSGIDPKFPANWSGARAAGLRRGAYHFFRAPQDSERQAQRFLAMLGEEAGELPPVLDFEILGDISADQGLRGAKRWMDMVEQACGRQPILYTGPTFWQTALGGCSQLGNHQLWIAHYTTSPQPILPSAWDEWTFWQYCEKGAVAGIQGPVDLDYFHGNLTELDGLCGRIQEKSAVIGS